MPLELQYVKLFEDSQAPSRPDPDDSGWDVFVHGCRQAYINKHGLKQHLEADEKGEIPGISVVQGDIVDAWIINPGERILVGTGIAARVWDPENPNTPYELQGRPRSGLAWTSGITINNSPGTIDFGFRNEIMVNIINFDMEAFTVKKGMKIAQLVPALVLSPELKEVESLGLSTRGLKGHGSSGV